MTLKVMVIVDCLQPSLRPDSRLCCCHLLIPVATDIFIPHLTPRIPSRRPIDQGEIPSSNSCALFINSFVLNVGRGHSAIENV